MDIRYEHCNKPLVLLNDDVKPGNIKRVIATGESIITRNKKIEVSLKI
jgi:hypothetical protein